MSADKSADALAIISYPLAVAGAEILAELKYSARLGKTFSMRCLEGEKT